MSKSTYEVTNEKGEREIRTSYTYRKKNEKIAWIVIAMIIVIITYLYITLQKEKTLIDKFEKPETLENNK